MYIKMVNISYIADIFDGACPSNCVGVYVWFFSEVEQTAVNNPSQQHPWALAADSPFKITEPNFC